MDSSKQTFTISAHKFYSPDYRRWKDKYMLDRPWLDIIEHAKKFGEVEITVGFDNSDPDVVRECVNAISWRAKNDFIMTYRGGYCA